ncbi:hypothetical protein [Rhodococcus jostii]|uniref:Uncharacterized protein n=1 Tax=Rhodococcus jostii TaxID=132919 RepID=A0ABU4CSU1_RHOJO|nr:hypothetical protein [Rhodococcus jostii]MDV6286629.1 hypothetical protein [Rhodococcus jostii]
MPAQLPERFIERVLVTCLLVDRAVAMADGGADDLFERTAVC